MEGLRRHIAGRGLAPSDLVVLAARGGDGQKTFLIERTWQLLTDIKADADAKGAQARDWRQRCEAAESLLRSIEKTARQAKDVLRGKRASAE